MSTIRNRVAIVGCSLLAGFLAGCSSPPTHYYMLSSIAGATPETLPTGAALQVDAVTIPPQLDRLQFVRRASANQLDISGLERWAAPLDEQIRRVLSEDLAERTAPGAVIGTQAAAPPPDRTHIAVDIDSFDGDGVGAVTLRAHWALVQQDQSEYRATANIDVPASGSDAGAIAAAMSTALGQLADQIVVAAARPKNRSALNETELPTTR